MDRREAAEGLMDRHIEAVFSRRTEALERFVVMRIMGCKLRLAEDRRDPFKTIWTMEEDDDIST